jgi:hypothetical protein
LGIKLGNPEPDQAPAGESRQDVELVGEYVPDGQILHEPLPSEL